MPVCHYRWIELIEGERGCSVRRIPKDLQLLRPVPKGAELRCVVSKQPTRVDSSVRIEVWD